MLDPTHSAYLRQSHHIKCPHACHFDSRLKDSTDESRQQQNLLELNCLQRS